MALPTNNAQTNDADATVWATRRDQVLVAIGVIAFIIFGVWLASHVTRALVILGLAMLVAYALWPLVRALSRRMPRFLALTIVYLLLIGILTGVIFLVIDTAITQLSALAPQIRQFLSPGPNGQPSPLVQALYQLGLSQDQINSISQQLTARVSTFANDVVPIVTGFVNSLLDMVLTLVISVYLIIDGQRVTTWLRTRTPLASRDRITSFLATLRNVIGGYIRGQLIMSTLIGVLVGGGMFAFHVPYAMLLGVLAFILEFIPILGTLTSGVICTLIALTQGWLIALGVLIYFVIVHIIEGDVVGPRVLSKAVGIHPAVSMFALVAGADLFGVLGALLASPIAGLVQAFIADYYAEWRKEHPDQFPTGNQPLAVAADAITKTGLPRAAQNDPVGKATGDAADNSPR